MENIFQPNDKFDFSFLSLAHPTGIQGGAYFTKIQMHNKPLYIETPKSLTRQGFVKNGKKIYCDLMFDNNDQEFIHWLESLENKCQELIHSKGDSWFESKLEINDIESAFSSPIRIYKSGKYYLVRVNVKVNYNTNIPSIKIYNENENPITIDDVTTENYMISILEIQGIKFTSRNFQIEMELKQAMVLSTEKIFESCLIKTSLKTSKPQETQIENIVFKANTMENLEEPEQILEHESVLESQAVVAEPKLFSENSNIEESQKPDIVESVENKPEENLKNEDSLELNLTEVNLDSDLDNLEIITLKKPNQVYYEIYKTARKKAKDAKRTAIMAFLEAKNIKKTYMLDDLDDSEDSEDSDMDIEDMSEEDLDSDLEKETSED